jgi:exportin-1
VYTGSVDERNAAQAILTQFKEHPQGWTRVDAIFEGSSSDATRFFACSALDECVKYRWKSLPRETVEEIKNYVVAFIIKLSSTPESLAANRLFLSKLNHTLVHIIRQEWPKHWESFIPEIVGSARTNEAICENNLEILRLLSEEVFDFSKVELTTARAQTMRNSFNKEFSLIFELCEFVLTASESASLVAGTLATLLRFLRWIPSDYIFKSQLVDLLVYKFFPVPPFRNLTTKCLTEIAQLQVGPIFDENFNTLFVNFMRQLATILPVSTDIEKAYENGDNDDQDFVEDLAMFLVSILGYHRDSIERNPDNHTLLLEAHSYLCRISRVEEVEVFKICLEYWHQFTSVLFEDRPMKLRYNPNLLVQGDEGGSSGRLQMYSAILSEVRSICISRMAKPEEVLVVKDPDTGELVRERTRDTDAIALYKTMRETLVFLTNLDYSDTHRLMLMRLQRQVDGSEWDWDRLNTLCWAVGSISGACAEQYEKCFVVTVIKDLLLMCEVKKGKDNKAVVASNIMYVVGQYPRFLRAHWRFLRTVVKKLFEFMHERHPGVQDMAMETFLKIAHTCKRKFVCEQRNETGVFIDQIIDDLRDIVSDLNNPQIHVFFEALGVIIGSCTDARERDRLIGRVMEMPNALWREIMARAASDPQSLRDEAVVKQLLNVLKTNRAAARTLGQHYARQLLDLFPELMDLYSFYATQVSAAAASGDPYAMQGLLTRGMRSVKGEICRLVKTYVETVSETGDSSVVGRLLLPKLLEVVVADFAQAPSPAKDAEVLLLMGAVCEAGKDDVTPAVPQLLQGTLQPTIGMITNNFTDFPEVRRAFFEMLRSINANCFEAFFNVTPDQFKLVIDAIMWSCKHTERGLFELGFTILQELFTNVERVGGGVQNSFYQSFFIPILSDVLAITTDTLHKSGFRLQATVLHHMLHLVRSQVIGVPLAEGQQNNEAYVSGHMQQLLATSFPNLTPNQVNDAVSGLFSLTLDLVEFKTKLRDFLITMKEFTSEENEMLYAEEREAEAEAMKAREEERAARVPGLAPRTDDDGADVDEDDDDLLF